MKKFGILNNGNKNRAGYPAQPTKKIIHTNTFTIMKTYIIIAVATFLVTNVIRIINNIGNDEEVWEISK